MTTPTERHIHLLRAIANIDPSFDRPAKMRPADYANTRKYWREVFSQVARMVATDLRDVEYRSSVKTPDGTEFFGDMMEFFRENVAYELDRAEEDATREERLPAERMTNV